MSELYHMKDFPSQPHVHAVNVKRLEDADVDDELLLSILHTVSLTYLEKNADWKKRES